MLKPALQLHVPRLEPKQLNPNSTETTAAFISPVSIKSTPTDTTSMDSHNSTTTPAAAAAAAVEAVAVESIGIHRGAIDHTTITTRPPKEVMTRVRDILGSIGVVVQPESTYKLRCIRPTRPPAKSDVTMDIQTSTMYADDPSRDPAGEVRFSVELTRLAGLNDTYSLDIRRLKGNLRSYQFLYETIREFFPSSPDYTISPNKTLT